MSFAFSGSRLGLVLIFALAVLPLVACGPGDENPESTLAGPVALSDQEDAVCGMLVREQSAPRSQIVHSDGSRFFFCSLGDMLVHLSAPSPHGRPEEVYVEVMRPDEDPSGTHTGAHPWVLAADAVYVVGIDRPGIMGAPVLAYEGQGDAESVIAQNAAGEVLDLAGLRAWWAAREAAR